MRLTTLTPAFLAFAALPLLAGCNDVSSGGDDVTDKEDAYEYDPGDIIVDDGSDDTNRAIGAYATENPLTGESLIMMVNAGDDVMLGSRSGAGGQGGYVVDGDLSDSAVEGSGFGAAATDASLTTKDGKDSYTITTPHGETRTLTQHNYRDVPERVGDLGGQWADSEGGLLLTITPLATDLITSRQAAITLGSEGGACYFEGSMTNYAPSAEETANLWEITINEADTATACTVNGHDLSGLQTGMATLSAPNGVEDPARELILITASDDTLAAKATRLFGRFTPAD